MEVESLIAIIGAVAASYTGIFVRLNALEARLTAHINANGKVK